jgi:phage-related protein
VFKYFWKHCSNSPLYANNNFRFLGFEHEGKLIILTNAFKKKDQKTPKNEIELAQNRKKEYIYG